MSNTNTVKVVSPETVWSMEQLTSDIAEHLGCEWGVAMDGLGSTLVPLYTFGRNSNLETREEQTNAVLSGQVSGIDLRATERSVYPQRTAFNFTLSINLQRAQERYELVLLFRAQMVKAGDNFRCFSPMAVNGTCPSHRGIVMHEARFYV